MHDWAWLRGLVFSPRIAQLSGNIKTQMYIYVAYLHMQASHCNSNHPLFRTIRAVIFESSNSIEYIFLEKKRELNFQKILKIMTKLFSILFFGEEAMLKSWTLNGKLLEEGPGGRHRWNVREWKIEWPSRSWYSGKFIFLQSGAIGRVLDLSADCPGFKSKSNSNQV